jgi:signal transduction histidine kinase
MRRLPRGIGPAPETGAVARWTHLPPPGGPGSTPGWMAGSSSAVYRDGMTGARTSLPTWHDAWLPALLAGLCALEVLVQDLPGRVWDVGLPLVACTLLVHRRRWARLVGPAAVLLLLVTPFVGSQLNDTSAPVGVIALATYALGRYERLRPGLIGLAVCSAAFALVWYGRDPRPHTPADVVLLAILLVPPYVLGRVVRRIAAQGRLLVAQERSLGEQAVRHERLRIARELHDVLAHSLSAMVVQTAVARDLVRVDPAGCEDRLDVVAATGRSALAETGGLVRVLGVRDAGTGAPAPGLVRLPELLEDFRARGLAVRLVGPATPLGTLVTLPPLVDTTAYRVLQEALHNAWRHGTGTADVHLRLTTDAVRLTVENPTTAVPPRPSRRSVGAHPGTGLGLRGVAERVAALEGRLEHEVRGGRHVLAVELPLEAPERVGPAGPDGAAGPDGRGRLHALAPSPGGTAPRRPEVSGALTWGDVWPPAGLAALCAAEALVVRGPAWVLVVALQTLAAVLLLWRRRHPVLVAPVAAVLVVLPSQLAPQLDTGIPIGLLALAAYALGRRARLRPGLAGLALLALGVVGVWVTLGGGIEHWTDLTWAALILSPPFVLGRVVRRMATLRELLAEQELRLEEEAVEQERLRIARELHSLLANSLSAMVVRTAAARDLVRVDPAAAEAGLDAVADAGRAALTETGRLLHVLRERDDDTLRPAPTLGRLGALVEEARRAGLVVEVALPDHAALADLSPAVDLTAARVVQETLAEARRAGALGTVRVEVERRPLDLRLTVTSPSGDPPARRPRPLASLWPGGGRGGTGGVAERVAVCGGTLDRRRTAGREVLRVVLPLEAEPPPGRPVADAPAPQRAARPDGHPPLAAQQPLGAPTWGAS